MSVLCLDFCRLRVPNIVSLGICFKQLHLVLLFVALRPSTYSRGDHGETFGRLEVGWKKVAFWSTRAAISLKRVKVEEKILWRTYRNSPTLFRTVQSPIPTASSSQRLGFATPSENSHRYIYTSLFTVNGSKSKKKWRKKIHKKQTI